MQDLTAPLMPTLARTAARTALLMGRSAIEQPVREKVALVLLDFIGGCFKASRTDAGRKMLAYAEGLGPDSRGPLPGVFRAGADAGAAALLHGMLGHALIREDMHVPSGTHPGVVILPAMLALARRENLSGEAVVRGIATGYHVMGTLGAAARTGLKNRRFRPLGISGPFGVAAGAIAATGVEDEEVAVNALAFAANFAAGFNQWPSSGGQEIYVHAGMAARNGLVALGLGRAGLRASPDILEGEDGLFNTIGSGPGASTVFLNKLAGPNCLLEVTHKPTEGCNFVQSAVAAALRLSKQLGSGGTQGINKIVISTFKAARDYPGCNSRGPFDYAEQRKMSFQFTICTALRHGRLEAESYSQPMDPEVERLINLTEIRIDEAFERREFPRQPARVDIFLNEGEHQTCTLPDVPWLSPHDVRSRFDHEIGSSLSNEDREHLHVLITNLWDAQDTVGFFALLDGVR